LSTQLNTRASRSFASTPKKLPLTKKRKSTTDAILSSLNSDTQTRHANNNVIVPRKKSQTVDNPSPNKKMKYALAASAAVAAAAGVYFTSHPTEIPWDTLQNNVGDVFHKIGQFYHSATNQ